VIRLMNMSLSRSRWGMSLFRRTIRSANWI